MPESTLVQIGNQLLAEIFRKAWAGDKGDPSWIREKYQRSDPFGLEARKYAQEVASRYNSMRVIGMDRPTPLEDIYINVNVRDRTQSIRSHSYEDFWEWEEAQDLVTYSEKTIPATEALSTESRLLVLGRPGAGKTTFLRYLAISAIGKKLPTNLVPILVSLREWSSQSTTKLETALVRQFHVCDLKKPREFVRNLLRKGRCLVLLDGFDEIDPGQRTMAINQIEGLSKDYPKNRYVLSCRTAANVYTFSGFAEVEIADFTDNQIEVFVRKWFPKDIAQKCLSELNSTENRGIFDLASNPLLLTLICIAYSETYSFPESRIELYETALEALLKKWDSSREIVRNNPYKRLTLNRKEMFFSKIAARGFERNVDLYPKSWMESEVSDFMKETALDQGGEVSARDILGTIESQHGILAKEGDRHYRFTHLTFQEYYTAKHVVHYLPTEKLINVFERYLGEPRWNEVILIVCGLHRDASRAIHQLKLALDKMRTSEIDAMLETAAHQVRSPTKLGPLDVLLALYQLMSIYLEETPSGSVESVLDLTSLTIARTARAAGIPIAVDSAAAKVTGFGVAENRKLMEVLVWDLFDQVESGLQRYLFALHILVSCLSGEANVPKSYGQQILPIMFENGCPEPSDDISGQYLFGGRRI